MVVSKPESSSVLGEPIKRAVGLVLGAGLILVSGSGAGANLQPGLSACLPWPAHSFSFVSRRQRQPTDAPSPGYSWLLQVLVQPPLLHVHWYTSVLLICYRLWQGGVMWADSRVLLQRQKKTAWCHSSFLSSKRGDRIQISLRALSQATSYRTRESALVCSLPWPVCDPWFFPKVKVIMKANFYTFRPSWQWYIKGMKEGFHNGFTSTSERWDECVQSEGKDCEGDPVITIIHLKNLNTCWVFKTHVYILVDKYFSPITLLELERPQHRHAHHAGF